MPELIIEKQKGIAKLILNRPDKCNALNNHLISELIKSINEFSVDSDVRVLVIKGNGKHFCAGADIEEMHNEKSDAEMLATLMYQLYCFPKPTLIFVQGAVYGGALGLVAASDIAITARDAKFCFSEVKMGIMPSIISPYVIAAIGSRLAKYYFLTGETFNAIEAFRTGLIHRVAEFNEFSEVENHMVTMLMNNGPNAMSEIKNWVHEMSGKEINPDLIEKTAQKLADLRITDEAQEGLKAFIEKRKPKWS